jgi:hypothetical protein
MSFTALFYNSERVEELNRSIYNRQFPSRPLTNIPQPRPNITRYVAPFQTNDYRTPIEKNNLESITPTNTFLAGARIPFKSFAQHIDDEYEVKGYLHPIMPDNPRTNYIPASSSELYNSYIPQQPNIQQHTLLQDEMTPYVRNMNPLNLGGNWFNNPTRQQVKNL